jgi:sialidase-1
MKTNPIHRLSAAIVFGSLLLTQLVGQDPSQQARSAPVRRAEQGLTESDIFISGTEGYHTYRIPSMLTTQRGTVLAFCEGRKNSSSDTGDIDMLVKRSRDKGQTWSRQKVIWDDGPNTCGNACPVVDQTTGTVWLLLTHNLGQDHELEISQRRSKGTRTVWVCKSEDDGVTWSKPIQITRTAKRPDWGWYATGPGVGIQLQYGPHAGRLLIPCDYSVQPDASRPDQFEYGDHVIYSDDHGKTWQLGGVVPAVKLDEPQVVELEDGSVMMNMRSHFGMGCRAVSLSKDSGETWAGIWHDKALVEPNCQASFLRYTGGPEADKRRILFSNPASNKERVNMTVRLSYDEGKSWAVSKQIYTGPSAYSCLTVLPDMAVGCLYERGGKNPYERITFARFSLEWLTDGADHL